MRDDKYIGYPTIMDSKYWWIVEAIVGILGLIAICFFPLRGE